MADELIHPVLASAAVHARITRTLVHVAQAPGVVVAARTLAPIAVYHVDATTAVRARITGALVYVGLTVLAGEAGFALTGVPGRRDIVSTENGRERDGVSTAKDFAKLCMRSSLLSRKSTKMISINGGGFVEK